MVRSRVELFEEIRKAHDREELGIRVAREPVRRPSKSGAPGTGVTDPAAAEANGAFVAGARSMEGDDRPVDPRKTSSRRRSSATPLVGSSNGSSKSSARMSVSRPSAVTSPRSSRDRPVSISKVMVPQIHLGCRGGRGRLRSDELHFLRRQARRRPPLRDAALRDPGRAFHRIYAGETQEVFLDGHVGALEPGSAECQCASVTTT